MILVPTVCSADFSPKKERTKVHTTNGTKQSFPIIMVIQLHQIFLSLDLQIEKIYKLGGLSHGFYSPRTG
jgi:hypothetical protein